MNIVLKRFRLPTGDEERNLELASESGLPGVYDFAKQHTHGEVRYEVIKVVGCITPSVGKYLTTDQVMDIIDTYTKVTFI